MATINFNNIVFKVKDEIKSTIKGEVFKPTEYDNYYISNFGRVVSANKSYYGIVVLKLILHMVMKGLVLYPKVKSIYLLCID